MYYLMIDTDKICLFISKNKIYFFIGKIKDLEHELKKSKIILIHKKKEKKMLSPDFTTKPGKCKTKSKYFFIVICLLN